MQFNFSLPDFSDIKDGGNLDKIEGYLATLNDQLRHALFNIDEENLSENLQNVLSGQGLRQDTSVFCLQ